MKKLLLLIIFTFPLYGYAQQLEPCIAKKWANRYPTPPETPITVVAGIQFRKKDTCLPIKVIVDWENTYQSPINITRYHHKYSHLFPGEIWVNDENQTMAIQASALNVQGKDSMLSVSGDGVHCLSDDCHRTYRLTGAYAKKLMGRNSTSLLWSTGGPDQEPIFNLMPTTIILTGDDEVDGTWVSKIDNYALSPLTYQRLIDSMQTGWHDEFDFSYNNNEDTDDDDSRNTGKVRIKTYIGCPSKLEIKKPINGDKFVFDNNDPAQLIIDGLATVHNFPDEIWNGSSDKHIKWTMPTKAGSQENVYSFDGGKKVQMSYNYMPTKNDDFGLTQIKAEFDPGGNCEKISSEVSVKLFYPKDAKNNPNGSVPNWYYYWSQTVATLGQVAGQDYVYQPNCEVSEDTKVYQKTESSHRDGVEYKKLIKKTYVCDLSRGPFGHSYLPVTSNDTVWKNIDAFGVLLLKSKYNWQYWQQKWNTRGYPVGGVYPNNPNITDLDADYLVDQEEVSLGYNPTNPQTHGLSRGSHQVFDSTHHHYKRAETEWHKGFADHEDWSHPGNQWRD